MSDKKEETSETPEVPETPKVEPTVTEPALEESDRAAMYEKFDKTTEETPGEVETEEETEEDPADPPEEEVPAEPAPEEAEKKEKTVSHGAFHAEREKRKGFQKEVTELKAQMDVMIKDNQALMQGKEEANIDDAEITDYDVSIKSLMKQNQELSKKIINLESKDTARTESEADRTEREQSERLNNDIATVDKELAAEGIPGFDALQIEVGHELKRLIAEDPANERLRTPNGWKEVYKDHVYPKYKKIFVGQEKTDILDEKKAKKEKANLASGGAKPASDKKKKDDDWDVSDYMKNRKKFSFSSFE